MVIINRELARALPSMLQRTTDFLKDTPQLVEKQKTDVALRKIRRELVEGRC